MFWVSGKILRALVPRWRWDEGCKIICGEGMTPGLDCFKRALFTDYDVKIIDPNVSSCRNKIYLE